MVVEVADRDVQFRGLSAERREALMIQVAKRYYELDMTMGDLAAELGLTRWQASKLLSEARQTGIVRIEIVPRAARRPDLESRLQRRYGLKDAVVVPCRDETDDRMRIDAVAQAAARFVAGLGRIPLIGVSWGRTMNAVADHLPPFWNEGVEVVLVNGATNIRSAPGRSNNTVELFARAANGTATILPVPAILGSAETRAALERDPTIRSILDLAASAPVVCFGMGVAGPGSAIVQSGFIGEAERADLEARGAVGDILSRFVDADGGIVDAALDARTIGLDLSALAARDYAIGVAAGVGKAAVARAAVRAGYLNVLVTDEPTAHDLLDEARHG